MVLVHPTVAQIGSMWHVPESRACNGLSKNTFETSPPGESVIPETRLPE
jgi:hypothetical protein